ncbi:MAG: methionyl-tRNA formyltransferase [Oscillospiraceae bacterium]|nr:methionyl-tRNA formyltransferase [Oscillospiraceae bacterium]
MALLNEANLTREDKERNSVHTEVRATYTVFEEDGKKYFQLDTYGKATRQQPEKISQSLQLDQETAKYLIKLLIDNLL